ncbi:MAG: phosphotransferase [Candidatus Latescibacteria bacterium]|nr:phosphotransferase [Candidatus Latescibacterota bacterium]
MKPFAQLSGPGQVRRLRPLALQALAQYGLTGSALRPLKHWNNTTFAVEAGQRRLVLRLNRPGFQDAAAIRSELQWLQALRAAGLRVPEPVPALDGQLVVNARAEGVPEPRDCALFIWLPGRFLNRRFGVRQLEAVGRFTAQLHCTPFALPPGFGRKAWDLHTLLGGDPGIDHEGIKAYLKPGEGRVIAAVCARLESAFVDLGRSPETWGLIHADLHPDNLLFQRGEVGAIDFDDCGWGCLLYDLAVTLSELRRRPLYPQLRQALLRGYRQGRHLPTAHEDYLDTFMAGRLLGLAIWTAGVGDHPANRARAPRVVADTLEQLQRFVLTGRMP